MISDKLEDMLIDLVNTQVHQTYRSRIARFVDIAIQIYYDASLNNIYTTADELTEFLEDLYDAKFPYTNTANNGMQMRIQPLVDNAVRWVKTYFLRMYGITI